MKILARIWRVWQINQILFRYGLDQLLFTAPLYRVYRFIRYCHPKRWLRGRLRRLPRGQRLRLALEALGPIFVKFGQSLSTRPDLLPADMIAELSKLQAQVAPFPSQQAQQQVEQALNTPLSTVFAEFERQPLASASIAQVHAARLRSGEPVVVKILRPGVRAQIARDLDLLYGIARLLERYWRNGRRLRPTAVVAEFERSILDELDLVREAANASQLRRNFLNSPLLYIPVVYWRYTRTTVLVMERIEGIAINDLTRLMQQGINLQRLAERGVEIFFTQVFRDCFFHADMHPGNIFVSPDHPDEPQYLGVDFGIVGTLSAFDQRYLAENLLAFFNRDYQRVAILHIESRWVPVTTRVDHFAATIRTVCEPIFERPLAEISFAQLLLRLFQTAQQFDMQIQPQLFLLQKTLFNVEGLGRQLYPTLDLWQTAKPFLERWMRQQVGPRALLRKVRQYAPYWAERLPEMPDLLYQTLMEFRQAQQPELPTVPPPPSCRTSRWLTGSGLVLLTGALLATLPAGCWQAIAKLSISWGLAAAGLGLLLAARCYK